MIKGVVALGVGFVLVMCAAVGGAVLTSIPFVDNGHLNAYQQVVEARQLQIPWPALVAVDAVRYRQDFSQVDRETIEKTADLFAQCSGFRPVDQVMEKSPEKEYGIAFGVPRPATVTYSVSEATGDVTAQVVDAKGIVYPSGSSLQPGTYQLKIRVSDLSTRYRLRLSLDMKRCGPPEVEQAMDRLGLQGDDRKMVLNIMATFLPPEELYIDPRPGGRFTWPVSPAWPITSSFGHRLDPVTGDWAFHSGVDIGAAELTDVHVAADGRVVFAGEDGNYGFVVRVEHGGFVTAYAHLTAFSVDAGQKVKRGDRIGLVGSTGKSTGPHLHFEWRLRGEPVDPLDMYR